MRTCTISRLSLVPAVLALLALPSPARAQIAGVDLELVPKIGAFLPAGDLGEVQGESVRLGSALAIGLGLELQLPFLPFNVRANLDHVPSTMADTDAALGEVDADVLGLAADLVFRPFPLLAARPYIALGAGSMRYNFTADNGGQVAAALPESASNLALHLAVGAGIGLGPLELTIELGDYISRFRIGDGERSVQNDFFGMVGFRVAMF